MGPLITLFKLLNVDVQNYDIRVDTLVPLSPYVCKYSGLS
jgi:hypothetical protein